MPFFLVVRIGRRYEPLMTMLVAVVAVVGVVVLERLRRG
jgi:hypothetical protein